MARTGPVTRDTSTVQLGLSQIRVGRSAPNIATATPVLISTDSMGAMASTSYTGETEFWELESGFPLGLDATFPLRESNMLECAFKEVTPKNLALARGLDPFADISASVIEGTAVTTLGTIASGSIAVTDTAGPINDTWTVVFSSATAFDVYGLITGHVGAGTTSADFEPDNGGNPYFSIDGTGTPFFTGTWAADESYTFTTTGYVAGTSAYANVHSGNIGLGTVAAPAFVRMEAVYTFPNGVNTMTIVFPRANVVSSLNIDNQAEDAVAVATTFKATGASSDATGGDAAWDSMPAGQIIFA